MAEVSDPGQHCRYNPLKGEWVLVSPHRLKRPWAGQVNQPDERELPTFDPKNPLCPGVTRPNGKVTENYTRTYVFENDFPALLEGGKELAGEKCEHALLKSKPAQGTCRVMCFHPHSNTTLPQMSLSEIKAVIEKWIEEYQSLSKKYEWVQIFENKGAIMGCSNPHPHCQIWATSFLPNEALKEEQTQLKYYLENGKSMLMDYCNLELEKKVRIVVQNKSWVVIVPYWAVWPYETLLLPTNNVSRLTELNPEMIEDLSEIMKRLLIKYDNLFRTSFPYSMGWHGAPTGFKWNNKDCKHWLLHAHYYPPLLRSATVQKFMVGYELLAQAQRDLTAEQAAKRLREQPETHYKEAKVGESSSN